jgi:hypothetical protein
MLKEHYNAMGLSIRKFQIHSTHHKKETRMSEYFQRTTGERRESVSLSKADLSPADQLVLDVFQRKYGANQSLSDKGTTHMGTTMSDEDAAAVALLKASLANT